VPLSPEQVRARTKISEDFYTVFSNQVRVAASATELRLFFGEIYPTATGEIKATENFSVVLTLIQAKSTLALLSDTIQRIEAMYGVIPVVQPLGKAELPHGEAPPDTEHKD
jgi:hypothetical protein